MASEFRVPSKEERKTDQRVAFEFRVPSSEFRVKKKERQIRGWHQRVASEFRVPSKEERKTDQRVASEGGIRVPSSE